MSRFPNFFTPRGVGDRLLEKAITAKVELHRWPTHLDDEPVESVIEFEVKGSLPLTGEGAAELLVALVQEFRQPRQPRQEGGVA